MFNQYNQVEGEALINLHQGEEVTHQVIIQVLVALEWEAVQVVAVQAREEDLHILVIREKQQ